MNWRALLIDANLSHEIIKEFNLLEKVYWNLQFIIMLIMLMKTRL